jgi:protein-tyrosine phosphatase
MAEAMLKAKLRRFVVFNGWKTASAGVYGLVGEPADPLAQSVARERGLDLSKHVARRVSEALIHQFDLILTMEKGQKEILRTAYPQDKDKILFLGEVAGTTADVFDPIGGPVANYMATAEELDRLINRGYLWMALIALQKSMEYRENDAILYDESQTYPDAYVDSILATIANRPPKVRYAQLRLLGQLYPQSERIRRELSVVSQQVPPDKEEENWLLEMRLQEVVIPITCLKTIKENVFRHPEIQSKLDLMRVRLENPALQDLFRDLEQLYNRNLPPFKYRLGIWDLTVKYPSLPFRIGDYEEAYRILHNK